MKATNAKGFKEGDLRIDNIAKMDLWECAAIGMLRFGIYRARSGGAVTTSKIITTDDEVSIRVDCFTRSDKIIPPTRLAFGGPPLSCTLDMRVNSGCMLRAG